MRRLPTAVPAAATLVAGFAVAQGTGLRALGGAVLVAGAAGCAWHARSAGPVRVGAVVLVAAGCFVASHVLARATPLGAWPSVAVAAAALGGATWLLVDRR